MNLQQSAALQPDLVPPIGLHLVDALLKVTSCGDLNEHDAFARSCAQQICEVKKVTLDERAFVTERCCRNPFLKVADNPPRRLHHLLARQICTERLLALFLFGRNCCWSFHCFENGGSLPLAGTILLDRK